MLLWSYLSEIAHILTLSGYVDDEMHAISIHLSGNSYSTWSEAMENFVVGQGMLGI